MTSQKFVNQFIHLSVLFKKENFFVGDLIQTFCTSKYSSKAMIR